MLQNRDNFLDAKTIMAIVFVFICFLMWDSYMRKKYPQTIKKQSYKARMNSKSLQLQSDVYLDNSDKEEEKIISFNGENINIEFSSYGLGIKKLVLNNYYDREKKNIQFSSITVPLFADLFLNTLDPIVFTVEKRSSFFIGHFFGPAFSVEKIIQVDDKNGIIEVTTNISPKSDSNNTVKGLNLVVSHLDSGKYKNGFLKTLLDYESDLFKGYVYHGLKQKEHFVANDIPLKYKQVHILALGGKYFGKAFINQSVITPSVKIQKQDENIYAYLNYSFLHDKTQSIKYIVLLGPKSFKQFKTVRKEINAWIDYGFFGFLARPLFFLLNGFHSWCNNWGWAIVFLTLFTKIILLPMNIKAYKSSKIMQSLQLEMKSIREKYKSDPKKMNLETMSLMKKHKANPLGGCLPMLLQIPVVFALFSVLRESVELYQSPFVFWIKDLSLKDPYYVLPILSGVVLFLQQKITPINLPKAQARIFAFIPLLFSVFMLSLPSGLTLYIFVSSFFSFIQSFFITKQGKGGKKC